MAGSAGQAGLQVQGITKAYAGIVVVDQASFAAAPGEFICFLGPSGCGKTTLLRMIAGLTAPTGGTLRLDGLDITGRPPHQRGFGMVFQSLALFPHLNVEENIGYSLRLRDGYRHTRRQRVAELLELVRLPGIGSRSVSQLSGGQRQRVAIARALAQEPRVLLMDEPFSALDAKLREELQIEVRQLLKRLGITTILVTHDQREAMALADTILVMAEGRMQQVGKPLDLYHNPANRFVAGFIGSSNLIEVEIASGTAVRFADHVLQVGTLPTTAPASGSVILSVRPEHVSLRRAAAGATGLCGTLLQVRDFGSTIEARVDCAGRHITSTSPSSVWDGMREADRVTVEFAPAGCRVLTS